MNNKIMILVAVITLTIIGGCAPLNVVEKQVVGRWYRAENGTTEERHWTMREQYDFAKTGKGYITHRETTNTITAYSYTYKFRWKIESGLLLIKPLSPCGMWNTYNFEYVDNWNIEIHNVNYRRDE